MASEYKEYRWVIKDPHVFLTTFKFDATIAKNYTDFYTDSNTRVRLSFTTQKFYLVEGKQEDKTFVEITQQRAIEYILKAKNIANKVGIGRFVIYGVEMYAELVNDTLQVEANILKENVDRFEKVILPQVPKSWVKIKTVFDFVKKFSQYKNNRYFILEELKNNSSENVNVDDQQLMNNHNLLHSYWAKLTDKNRRTEPGWASKSKMIRFHRDIVREMLKRKLTHIRQSDLDDSLPKDLLRKMELQKTSRY